MHIDRFSCSNRQRMFLEILEQHLVGGVCNLTGRQFRFYRFQKFLQLEQTVVSSSGLQLIGFFKQNTVQKENKAESWFKKYYPSWILLS